MHLYLPLCWLLRDAAQEGKPEQPPMREASIFNLPAWPAVTVRNRSVAIATAISLVCSWAGAFAPQNILGGASALQGQDIMGGAAIVFKRPQKVRDLIGGA